jgi:hypothetical protein
MLRPRSLFALLVVALLAPPLRAEQPFRYPEGKHGKGELKYVHGLPVLTVEGTPEEIGEQIGTLAIKPNKGLTKLFKDFLAFQGGDKLWPLLVKGCNQLAQQMPADYRKELDAMAKASGFDRDILVVANTILDVMKIGGCSTLVVEPGRSASGGLLFGRNLDFPPLGGQLPQYTLVIVYRPKGKRSFVGVGFPGVLGQPSGINDAGLALASNEIRKAADGSPPFNPKGVPMVAYYRRLLEECGSVAEAEKLTRTFKPTTMSSVTLCDKKEGVVFEVTPKTLAVRRADKGVCCCTNHFCCKGLTLNEKCWRYPILEKCRDVPKLKFADVAKKLHEVNQGQFTIQSMIFEPATLKLHLAFGKGPCTGQPLKTLELKPRLRRD